MKKKLQIIWKMKLQGLIIAGIISLTFLFAFAPQRKERIVPSDAEKEKNPITSDAASITAGKKIYNYKCYACHGSKGKGDGPKSAEFDSKPQDFTNSDFQKQSDGALCWKITKGNTTMPCFKRQMTKDQRWEVINYIRTFAKS